MSNELDYYAAGLVKACEAYGVDPEALVKTAQAQGMGRAYSQDLANKTRGEANAAGGKSILGSIGSGLKSMWDWSPAGMATNSVMSGVKGMGAGLSSLGKDYQQGTNIFDTVGNAFGAGTDAYGKQLTSTGPGRFAGQIGKMMMAPSADQTLGTQQGAGGMQYAPLPGGNPASGGFGSTLGSSSGQWRGFGQGQPGNMQHQQTNPYRQGQYNTQGLDQNHAMTQMLNQQNQQGGNQQGGNQGGWYSNLYGGR